MVTCTISPPCVLLLPAIHQYGFGFLTGTVWNPKTKVYSILPEIWGTLYSSVFALILAIKFGLAAAVFLAEGFVGDSIFALLKVVKLQFHPLWGKRPAQADNLFRNLIELLAAIPSVLYGLWGIFVVIPMIKASLPLASRRIGLDSAFRYRSQRTRNVSGRNRALDHDLADDYCDQPRRVGRVPRGAYL